jgi:hypothetical protein
METFKQIIQINEDGTFTMTLTTPFPNQRVEMLVVLQSLRDHEVDALGWPIGYFEETYSILADELLERGDRGDLERRESFN